MNTITISTAIILLTWMFVQVLKPLINSKFAPFLALIIGLILGAVASFLTKDNGLYFDLFVGVVSGFASTGINETATKSINQFANSFLDGLSNYSRDDKKEDSSKDENVPDSKRTNGTIVPDSPKETGTIGFN